MQGQFAFSTGSLKAEVEADIKKAPIVIYSKTFCPFCKQTKEVFSNLKADPAPLIHELDTLSDGAQRQAALAEITGKKTVPNIFINGQHVGGNSDLCNVLQDGSLADMLHEANVKFSH